MLPCRASRCISWYHPGRAVRCSRRKLGELGDGVRDRRHRGASQKWEQSSCCCAVMGPGVEYSRVVVLVVLATLPQSGHTSYRR